MNVIFLGPPGAGKGTQAQVICSKFGIPQISTGDMLRSAIANRTATGLNAKEYMDAGKLVPDDVVIAIVKERLAQADCAKGYILDGFPRTVKQAEELARFARIDAVINLCVEDEKIVDRLSGRRVCSSCGAPYHTSLLGDEANCKQCDIPLIQRDDDRPETVLSRLSVYHEQTSPLIGYYRNMGLIRDIDGSQTLEQISEAIIMALEACE